MTTNQPGAPALASAAVLVREDGRVLLVRHSPSGPFAGMWTFPLAAVATDEAAEDTIDRILRQALHVRPGPCEFEDTLYLEGLDGTRYVLNAFTCVGWEGEPRYSEREYQDAAWVATPPADMALPSALRDWFATALGGDVEQPDAAALDEQLTQLREELVEAFEAIPEELIHERLDGTWSPLDVLAHSADVEAYYMAETRRLLEIPGHTWRGFNDAQWEESHRLYREVYGPDEVRMVSARLEQARVRTRRWLASLTLEDLERYGNHPERGAVRIGERVQKLARHEREHLEQLRAMGNAARLKRQADVSGTDVMGGEPE
jgi:ADP-ribose pyrophosphatase YjhB (NUDIX family)